jgi:hypothetical protein
MADYDTGRDIVEDMLARAGELPLNAAELASEARRYANRGYFNLLRQFPWLCAEGYPPFSFVTKPKQVLTDLAVSYGSSVITTTEPMNPGFEAWGSRLKIVVDRDGVPFRIIDHWSQPNILNLAVPYPFPSGEHLTGYSYQDEYYMKDILIGTRLKNISKPSIRIAIIGYEEMDMKWPVSIPFGNIVTASFYTEEYLRLAMIPEQAELLELHHTKRPPKLDFTGNPATDTPIFPPDERWLIADYGLYFLLVDHGDDRAQEVAQIAAGRVAEIKDRQLSKMSPRIFLPDAFSIAVRD